MARSSLFAGAAALALIVSAVGCGGSSRGGDGPPLPPAPEQEQEQERLWPGDAGVAARRASMPSTDASAAALGEGRDILRSELRLLCASGPVTWTDAPGTLQRLAHPLSPGELEALLAPSDPAERLGLLSGGGIARLGEALLADPRSVPLVYAVVRSAGRATLDRAAVAFAPTLPAPGEAGFTARCGDEVLVEEERGAEIFLLLRLDFATEAARATFSGAVGDDVALWDLPARLAAADAVLHRSYTLSILVHQRGGAPAAPPLGDAGALVSCAGGDPARCASLAEAFVAYATGDGPADLPAQAAAHPGPLAYRWEPWSAVTTAAPAARLAPADVIRARASLAARLDDRVRVRERIENLLRFSFTLSDARFRVVRAAQDAVAQDLLILRQALERCYALAGPDDAAAIDGCTAAATPEYLSARGYAGTPALSELDD